MTTKRALIVDDSKTAQHRLKKLLRHYDLSIVAVDSGEAALRYLSSKVPDVVFMDHLMPGLDGFRALQIIKSHPATATIPVIMYTSKSGDVYTSEARALGALGVVNKDRVNAADLRNVLQSIHIYERERTSEDPSPAGKRHQEPQETSESDEALSVELRLRELEHTIDDNRRIMTSRLVREMQSVRHGMRKVLNDLEAFSRQSESGKEPETSESPSHPHSRVWVPVGALVATLVMSAVLGSILYWIPGIHQKLDTLASTQATLSEQVTRMSTEQPAVETLLRSVSPEPDIRDTFSLLPDLSWAINQHSVQDFHAELINPQLVQRVTELVSRLSSHDYQGEITLNVRGGNFCLVTNLSGQPRLPANTALMRDCMLMSDLYGADATDLLSEQLESELAGEAPLNETDIVVKVQPLASDFETYPEPDPQSPAKQWNQVAHANNRVLIDLEPVKPTRTAQR